jgi:hypothetical protein
MSIAYNGGDTAIIVDKPEQKMRQQWQASDMEF